MVLLMGYLEKIAWHTHGAIQKLGADFCPPLLYQLIDLFFIELFFIIQLLVRRLRRVIVLF